MVLSGLLEDLAGFVHKERIGSAAEGIQLHQLHIGRKLGHFHSRLYHTVGIRPLRHDIQLAEPFAFRMTEDIVGKYLYTHI
ncbi:hypothetical protein SDC9_201842 [bioreactor metagenome]|uniref:Uncharacterized protein n=1 Tax=bioreactor metagenome TaxID=1076179 RepID=A0A645J3V8_9ZZZZ